MGRGKPATKQPQQRTMSSICANAPWPVLLVCWAVIFCCMGYVYGAGAIFTDVMDTFRSSQSLTGLVQSLCNGLLFGAGLISGPFYHKYGALYTMQLGNAMAISGFVIAFFATDIVLVIIGVGGLVGAGVSFNFLTCYALAGVLFPDLRSFTVSSLGVATAVGASLFPRILRYLVETYALRGTFLIMAGVNVQMVLCGVLAHVWSPRKKPPPGNSAKPGSKPSVQTRENGDTEARSQQAGGDVLNEESVVLLPSQTTDTDSPLFFGIEIVCEEALQSNSGDTGCRQASGELDPKQNGKGVPGNVDGRQNGKLGHATLPTEGDDSRVLPAELPERMASAGVGVNIDNSKSLFSGNSETVVAKLELTDGFTKTERDETVADRKSPVPEDNIKVPEEELNENDVMNVVTKLDFDTSTENGKLLSSENSSVLKEDLHASEDTLQSSELTVSMPMMDQERCVENIKLLSPENLENQDKELPTEILTGDSIETSTFLVKECDIGALEAKQPTPGLENVAVTNIKSVASESVNNAIYDGQKPEDSDLFVSENRESAGKGNEKETLANIKAESSTVEVLGSNCKATEVMNEGAGINDLLVPEKSELPGEPYEFETLSNRDIGSSKLVVSGNKRQTDDKQQSRYPEDHVIENSKLVGSDGIDAAEDPTDETIENSQLLTSGNTEPQENIPDTEAEDPASPSLREVRRLSRARQWLVNFFHPQLFANIRFTTIVLTLNVWLSGMTPSIFLTDMARDGGFSVDDGSLFLSVVFAGNLMGRVMSGVLAHFLKAYLPFVFGLDVLCLGAACFSFSLTTTYAGYVSAACLYGLCVGTLLNCCPLLLLDILGPEKYALGCGYLTAVSGVFVSLNGPLGGVVREKAGSYRPMFYLAALQGAIMAAVVFLVFLRHRFTKEKVR